MACLSEMQKGEVETLAAVLNCDQIADYFGIGRRTFFSMIARDPEIAALYKKGKARAIGSIAQSLIAKARSGDTASMIFFLKTQAGWREHRPYEEELPGEDDPTQLDLPSMSTELLRLLQAAASSPRIGEHRAVSAPTDSEAEQLVLAPLASDSHDM